MLWLYRFITGFLDVEFSGDVAEVILNICAKNGISLWNVKRKNQKIRCMMTVRDFKALPAITRKSGIRAHILRRYGLPFITVRYRHRWGIPAGALIFFAFIKFMSCFIWTVEINGNEKVAAEDIISACEKIGVYEGVPKNGVDPQNAKQKLLLELDSLAWASFNIEGCRLTVNVSEIVEKAEDNSVPTNLKSTSDGIITKIDVVSGNCVVKVGDTVGSGDLLVSGVIERADNTKFVHSSGSITAKIEKEITVSATYERKITVKTGKRKRKSVFSFFGIKIPLYLGCENGSYESRLEVKQASLFGRRLPIRLYNGYFEKTEEKTVVLSKNELLEELETLLQRQAEVENLSDFEVKNREFDEIQGGISLKAVISAEKDIAAQEILLFNAGN